MCSNRKATLKPSARLSRNCISMACSLAEECRPEGKGLAEALHEHQDGQNDQREGQDQHLPQLELMPGKGRNDHQSVNAATKPSGLSR